MPESSRRDFLRAATAGAAAWAGLPPLLSAARKKIPLAVQLYSVGRQAAADTPGVIAAVKKMGYDGVEFAGYYKHDAPALRKMLDDNGLACCGSHVGLNTLLGDELAKTIEFNKILGNKFLVVPGLPKENTATIEAWSKTADTFNEIAEKVKKEKMFLGYHNHTAEFAAMGGQVPWDVFFGKAKKTVFMQLDIGHCLHGGGDPVAVLNKYKGRALTVHVKEWSNTKRDAVVGEGDVKWPEVFRACESVGGTQWYIIEEETRAYQGLTGIEKSVVNLKKLLGRA